MDALPHAHTQPPRSQDLLNVHLLVETLRSRMHTTRTSIRTLARALRVSEAMISRMLANKHKPTAEYVARILLWLDIPIKEFYSTTDRGETSKDGGGANSMTQPSNSVSITTDIELRNDDTPSCLDELHSISNLEHDTVLREHDNEVTQPRNVRYPHGYDVEKSKLILDISNATTLHPDIKAILIQIVDTLFQASLTITDSTPL